MIRTIIEIIMILAALAMTHDRDVHAATLTITYCKLPLSISGTIFLDHNENGVKDAKDDNYTGPITIGLTSSEASFPVTNNNGAYTANNLGQGEYTIAFSGLSKDIKFIYPLPSSPGSPPSLIVKVGETCSCPTTHGALCTTGTCASAGTGSISNLNVGVVRSEPPWFQSVGSDMRWDSGFSLTIPSDKYASLPGIEGMPGIIFSGKITPSFGSGQASQNPFNWKIGSPQNPDVFTDTHNLIPTSYRFLLETVDSSAITKRGVTHLCSSGSDPTNCTLTPALVNGVYFINNNLTLNGTGATPSYTFPTNKNFVILVNGNLTINEKILVPIGSTVIFSVSGNITVNQAVGEAASSTTPTLEGLYSADNNFVADQTDSCPGGTHMRLNIAGSVIANAGRSSGTFVNRRNLCGNNSFYPSVSFIERPDFMLNYPSLVTQTTRAWQEVAP